jgi:trans-aconitate 2-methyltransferase
MWETQYLHVLDSRLAIIEWTRATGMKPYLDSLSKESEQAEFEREVLCEIEKDYPLREDGKVLFPFKRLFMSGQNNSSKAD